MLDGTMDPIFFHTFFRLPDFRYFDSKIVAV